MKHSQLTDELQVQASLYAAGAMTESERQEYVRHLEDDGCAICKAEVVESQAAISLLAFDAPAAAPSPAIRERLMEQARAGAPRSETKSAMPFLRRHWLEIVTSALAAGAVAIALLATQANREMRLMTAQLTSRISQLEVQLARNRDFINTLTSPQVRVVSLAGQGANVQASGRLFWDQTEKRWYFYARSLPRVPAGKTYELWFVPKTGNPVKAVVFNTESSGVAEFALDVPAGLDLRAAAVTTEPAGGTDLPTGPFALLGAL